MVGNRDDRDAHRRRDRRGCAGTETSSTTVSRILSRSVRPRAKYVIAEAAMRASTTSGTPCTKLSPSGVPTVSWASTAPTKMAGSARRPSRSTAAICTPAASQTGDAFVPGSPNFSPNSAVRYTTRATKAKVAAGRKRLEAFVSQGGSCSRAGASSCIATLSRRKNHHLPPIHTCGSRVNYSGVAVREGERYGSGVRASGQRVGGRRGRQVAVVAVARKLASLAGGRSAGVRRHLRQPLTGAPQLRRIDCWPARAANAGVSRTQREAAGANGSSPWPPNAPTSAC